MILIELCLFLTFIGFISCGDNVTEYKQQYCSKGGGVRAACFALEEEKILYLFAFDMFFELKYGDLKIVNVYKVTDYWPELNNELSVDAACSTISGLKKGKQQYIFQKNFQIFVYTVTDDGMELTMKGDIREYDTFGLENYPKGEDFICGACYNEQHIFTLTAFARSTQKMYYCRYRDEGKDKKCGKLKQPFTPYNIERSFLDDPLKCSALAYNAEDDSDVITVFVDSQNLTVYQQNDLLKQISLKELFGCPPDKQTETTMQEIVGIKIGGHDFPLVLVVVIVILVSLFALFIVAFFWYKRRRTTDVGQQGHIMKMVAGKH